MSMALGMTMIAGFPGLNSVAMSVGAKARVNVLIWNSTKNPLTNNQKYDIILSSKTRRNPNG